jgi:hypothetical protein
MPPEEKPEAAEEIVTVITMYRGVDAEFFVQVVNGSLSAAQRDEWRKAHLCDDHYPEDEDDQNSMFFRELLVKDKGKLHDLDNVDGEGESAYECL